MAPAGAMAPTRANRTADLSGLLLEQAHELFAEALTSTVPSTPLATAAPSPFDTTLPPEPVVERTAAMFVYALFLVLIPTATILGNALVILSVLRFKALHSAINFLILGLAVADLFVAVFVMPYAVYVYIQGGNWFLGNLMCDIYNASDVACSTASIFLLAVISFDRYRAVSRPIQYSRQSQNIRRVIVILVLIWVVSLALASPIVLGLNHRPPDASPYECRFYNPEFSVGSSIVSFIVPCIIVLFVYIRIMMALRKREKAAKMRRLASQQQDNRNDGSTDEVDAGQIVAAPAVNLLMLALPSMQRRMRRFERHRSALQQAGELFKVQAWMRPMVRRHGAKKGGEHAKRAELPQPDPATRNPLPALTLAAPAKKLSTRAPSSVLSSQSALLQMAEMSTNAVGVATLDPEAAATQQQSVRRCRFADEQNVKEYEVEEASEQEENEEEDESDEDESDSDDSMDEFHASARNLFARVGCGVANMSKLTDAAISVIGARPRLSLAEPTLRKLIPPSRRTLQTPETPNRRKSGIPQFEPIEVCSPQTLGLASLMPLLATGSLRRCSDSVSQMRTNSCRVPSPNQLSPNDIDLKRQALRPSSANPLSPPSVGSTMTPRPTPTGSFISREGSSPEVPDRPLVEDEQVVDHVRFHMSENEEGLVEFKCEEYVATEAEEEVVAEEEKGRVLEESLDEQDAETHQEYKEQLEDEENASETEEEEDLSPRAFSDERVRRLIDDDEKKLSHDSTHLQASEALVILRDHHSPAPSTNLPSTLEMTAKKRDPQIEGAQELKSPACDMSHSTSNDRTTIETPSSYEPEEEEPNGLKLSARSAQRHREEIWKARMVFFQTGPQPILNARSPLMLRRFVCDPLNDPLEERERLLKLVDNSTRHSVDDASNTLRHSDTNDHDVGNSSSPLSSSDSLSDNIHVVTNDFVSEAPTSMSRKSSEYESQHTNGTHPGHPHNTYHSRNRRLSRESSLLRNPMKRFKSLHVSPRNIALPTVDIARPADIWRHFSRRSPRIFGPQSTPSPKIMQKKYSYAEEGLFGTTTPLLDAGRRKSDTSAFAQTPPNGAPEGLGAWVTEEGEPQRNIEETEEVAEPPKLPLSPKSPAKRFEGALTSAVLGEDMDYVDVDSMQGSLTGAYAKPPPIALYSQETTSSATDLREEKIQEAAIEEEPANPPNMVSNDEHSALNDATIATDSGLGPDSREHNEVVITNLNAMEAAETPRKISKSKRHEEAGSPTVTFKIPGKHREKSSRNDRPMKRLSSAAQIYENKRTVDKNVDQEADLKHKRSFSQRLRGSLGAVVGPTNSRSEHSMDSCYSSSQSQGTNTTVGAGNSSGSKESKKGKVLANSKANGSTTELAVRMVKKAINRKESSLKRKVNKAQRKEKRATKTLGIVVGIFLICWVPFFFINILSGICIKLNIESCQVGFGPFFYATWIGYMNSFMNPVIYTIFNTEFRRAFKSLLLGKSNNRRNRGHPV
ncbi:unnamed protein product [Bursaphelenchus xylophilus]|uniref:(pine wood nematode) hypothetical protein n=1 Tax=Bursaphelenchus xylophilus TaxID=6326 RepID=A0A1I7RXC9_BURXY|nr:unnamed protein product [Bursaphelenchus xylophilus]CAG9126278.1 unnamed protein product [Bursaphelenchus xylophilus]